MEKIIGLFKETSMYKVHYDEFIFYLKLLSNAATSLLIK
uniref:Uncharacterized protein n=1 Tax=Yersinia ruckeri TaxID=29486 RepID=A0A0A8VLT1_YERRU|nr:hypothetical protein CSF007_14190 [Yersinia ruckeri]